MNLINCVNFPWREDLKEGHASEPNLKLPLVPNTRFHIEV